LFIPVCVFSFFVCFLSPLVWFFLWLPEEVLTLLFLLQRENGDFSILMKDIIGRKLLNHLHNILTFQFCSILKSVLDAECRKMMI
jgi:hypothetical protein